MRAVKSRDTRPELLVRRLLRPIAPGYRLNRADIPGKPDIAFIGAKQAIFVHGCFWHRHPGCRFAYTPKSNTRFWLDKLEGNARRDALVLTALDALGWEVLIVWECEVSDLPTLTRKVSLFLETSTQDLP